VLDALLADGRLEIAALTGASAGALNAVLLAAGYAEGGREGARATLRAFWEQLGAAMPAGVAAAWGLPRAASTPAAERQALRGLMHLAHYFSPYELNPFDINPLRDILAARIDFARLRRARDIELWIAATEVSSGALRLFGRSELTLEALLASACLPTIHHSIEIDGRAYWDGGLSANPPLFPLFDARGVDDLVLVLLQGPRPADPPVKAEEIANRVSEIAFGAALGAELRALAWMQRQERSSFLGFGRIERRVARLRLHAIAAPDVMGPLDALSRANTHPSFIATLFAAGAARAEEWLAATSPEIGIRATFDPFAPG
jgi:NTE family protein